MRLIDISAPLFALHYNVSEKRGHPAFDESPGLRFVDLN
jgi:hypothetical protein